MPIYEYQCPHCQHHFEVKQKVDEAAPSCPQCHKDGLCRVYSPSIGVHFKGSGFYETDYKEKKGPSCCGKNCSCSH